MTQPNLAGFELRPEALIKRALEDSASSVAEWLKENGPDCAEEQAHLDEDSRERVYWHYGYLVALRDALALIQRQR